MQASFLCLFRLGVRAVKTRVDRAALQSLGEAFAARLQVCGLPLCCAFCWLCFILWVCFTFAAQSFCCAFSLLWLDWWPAGLALLPLCRLLPLCPPYLSSFLCLLFLVPSLLCILCASRPSLCCEFALSCLMFPGPLYSVASLFNGCSVASLRFYSLSVACCFCSIRLLCLLFVCLRLQHSCRYAFLPCLRMSPVLGKTKVCLAHMEGHPELEVHFSRCFTWGVVRPPILCITGISQDQPLGAIWTPASVQQKYHQ